MKQLLCIVFFLGIVSAGFSQGQLNFQNGSTTLIHFEGRLMDAAPSGSFYFGVFAAPVGTLDPLQFTFTGAYGTNINMVAGRLFGGTSAVVNNWPAGTARAVLVRGWSGDLGHDWDPTWLTTGWGGGPNTVFGTSIIAPQMTAGGRDSSGNPVPSPVLFSSTGIPDGTLHVPEPTTMALAALGAAALLIFRRRK